VSDAAVRIEPLTTADVASAVGLAVRVLGVKPGDRGEQFAADVTGEQRQMFVAKANGQLVGYGRVLELSAEEAGPGTPAGYYLAGVLVDPVWRGHGIATALTRARLRWAFARTGTVFYVTGADNAASLRLHAALGFVEIKRFVSERSVAGVDVLSQLVRTGGRPLMATRSPSRRHPLLPGSLIGASHGSRARTISLGNQQIEVADRPDLGSRCTVGDRHRPCDTTANGPLMARGPTALRWGRLGSCSSLAGEGCGLPPKFS
jgi:ribosomal protein S18 acetylase RimI-like enzyme